MVAPRRAVEVGCGPGDFAARLEAAGVVVTAVDQSAQMVELAQRRGVGARVMRETGEAPLHAHYDDVRLVDLPATVEMITASTAVFVASRVR